MTWLAIRCHAITLCGAVPKIDKRCCLHMLREDRNIKVSLRTSLQALRRHTPQRLCFAATTLIALPLFCRCLRYVADAAYRAVTSDIYTLQLAEEVGVTRVVAVEDAS